MENKETETKSPFLFFLINELDKFALGFAIGLIIGIIIRLDSFLIFAAFIGLLFYLGWILVKILSEPKSNKKVNKRTTSKH